MATHPLHSRWTCYGHKACHTNDYRNSIVQIGVADTIESFWCLFNNIPKVSECFARGRCLGVNKEPVLGMSFFRDDVAPEWEHPRNKGGARWEFKGCIPVGEVETVWTSVLLSALGGAHEDSLNGVRVVYKNSKRAFYRIELWFSVAFKPGDLDFLAPDVKRLFERCQERS